MTQRVLSLEQAGEPVAMVCSQWPAPAEAMDLRQMPYSRMVLQETLRIRPSSWLVPRTAVADDEIDTYHIPAGAMLLSLAFAGPLLVGACLVAAWQARQLPIIAYVMTRAEWKQRG